MEIYVRIQAEKLLLKFLGGFKKIKNKGGEWEKKKKRLKFFFFYFPTKGGKIFVSFLSRPATPPFAQHLGGKIGV